MTKCCFRTQTPNRAAFTLVELLVVIAIIGLLSTIAVVALGSVRRQARNTKRIADVKQLVTAFSLGLDANGTYPSSGGDVYACIASTCTASWSGFAPNEIVNTFFQTYMATKPTDPNDNNSRLQGGYLYNGQDPSLGGVPGINYLLEPPATCGVGQLIGTNANYVWCGVKLE